MTVLKFIPIRFLLQLLRNRNNNFIHKKRIITFLHLPQFKPGNIPHPQILCSFIDNLISFLNNPVSFAFGNGCITRTLEKLDFFFPLQFFQSSIVFDKVLFIQRKFYSFKLRYFRHHFLLHQGIATLQRFETLFQSCSVSSRYFL